MAKLYTTGVIHYDDAPVTPSQTANRIILTVAVENVITEAVVDTGAPYPIIAPQIAKQAGLNQMTPLERITMLVSGSLKTSLLFINPVTNTSEQTKFVGSRMHLKAAPPVLNGRGGR
jgi:predicted aspartyl protease